MEVDCVANETSKLKNINSSIQFNYNSSALNSILILFKFSNLGRLDQDGYATLCGDLKCLPPCNDLSYETSVSYLPYGNEDKFDFSEAPPRFQSL